MLANSWFTNQILFNGLVSGLIYGLLAMSIVLVHRSSKVINFAVGSLGLVGSAVLVMCAVNYKIPYGIALPIGLLAGVALSAIVELTVVRRLFRAPRVILLVATIGVSQLAEALTLAIPEVEDGGRKYPLPFAGTWKWAGISVKAPALLVLIVVPVVAVALAWFLNRTYLGMVIRAASTNPDLSRLRQINPKRMSTIVWTISGLVATIALILQGGVGGGAANLSGIGAGTLLRALTAALIARFRSFRVALAAGALFGVAEKVFQFKFSKDTDLLNIVLLVVVLVTVALQRDRRGGNEVFAFNPKVEALPEQLSKVFWVRSLDRLTMLAMLAAGVLLPFVFTKPSQHVLYASVAATAISAMSVTVLTGWAGQLSLAQASFAGFAALLAAAFTRGFVLDWSIGTSQFIYFRYEPLPFVVSILIATVLTAAVAALVGWGSLRLGGLLLAVATFAFAVAASSWIFRRPFLTRSDTSERAQSVEFRRGSLFGLDLNVDRTYYLVVLAVVALVAALLGRIRRSGVGRVTLAVRDNEIGAAAYTVKPNVAKLRMFALAGAIAALGGCFLGGVAEKVATAEPRFGVVGALNLVAIVVIGGMASIAGAIVGTVWVVGLPKVAPGNEVLPLLSSSIGLLILLMYFPGGFANVFHRIRGSIYRSQAARSGPITKSAASDASAVTAIARRSASREMPQDAPSALPLKAADVTVVFGGVRANDGASIEVRAGEIVGLIGTNGAGKSTLMNAIGGFVPVKDGRIELFGNDIGHFAPAKRARLGLGRTFQAATLFPELTVLETVSVALESRARSSLLETMVFSPRAARLSQRQRGEARELIDFLGLGRYATASIADLSTGTRRIVELAGLLALDAKVLCLDEPTAGIAQREAEAMGPLLVQIRRELDASMLIIEHDMPLIMGMSDRVYCLEQGRVIAEGLPDAVRNDPLVIASYLGTDDNAIGRSGAPAR